MSSGVDAVKDGAIRHFFLIAGCDGASTGRNGYTEFVRQTPKDTVVLTLACGKYRFNDLLLSMVLSWYEQKVVCILQTLLHLGIKNIPLDPALPAFVSPIALNFPVEKFGIAPITTLEEDMKAILANR